MPRSSVSDRRLAGRTLGAREVTLGNKHGLGFNVCTFFMMPAILSTRDRPVIGVRCAGDYTMWSGAARLVG